MAENLNENKKVNINNNQNEFKKLNELKKDDVAKLDTVPFTVKTIKTRYGVSYSGSIPFGKGHLNFRLDENAVLLIGEIRKVNVLGREFTIQAFIRYVNGIDKNGSEYYQAQLLVGTGCYFTTLINNREKTLLDIWIKNGEMKPINWVTCPSKELEEGLGYFEN